MRQMEMHAAEMRAVETAVACGRTASAVIEGVQEALAAETHEAVRRRAVRQLVEALLYEGLLPAQARAVGGEMEWTVTGRDARGRPVTYRFRGRRRFTFDRVRLTAAPTRQAAGEAATEANAPAQILFELREALGADADRLTRFARELERTVFHDALAQHARVREGRTLRGKAYDDLEGDVMDGHPYHPAYKSRVGFTVADNVAYGPEFRPDIRPLWVAAHRASARREVSRVLDAEAFLRAELGDEVYERFCAAVRRWGERPEDYVWLPVHTWQWERVAVLFADDLRRRRLILLGTSDDVYRPQQSIRTLANRTAPRKASLKLAMSLVNTSTSRVLAPHTVQNAPRISDWLKGLVARDPYLRDELGVVLLGEVMGVCYDRPDLLAWGADEAYGALGCIWRESPHLHLKPGEAAAPFNALCALDLDGRPFIEPWVRAHGLEPWLRRLLEVSVLPIVRFLVAHGVALEAHAQNMLLVHRDGWPVRVMLRDFHDGVRFSRALLAEPAACPALCPTPEAHARVNRNSFVETDDPVLVRDFVLDAFFFINLGELALFLADRLGYPEERFWGLARDVIEGYRARFAHLADRFAYFDPFAPTIGVEQLAKRRLFPDTELRVQAVPNPLARVAGCGTEGGDGGCVPTA